jgi:hypothetical protein
MSNIIYRAAREAELQATCDLSQRRAGEPSFRT